MRGEERALAWRGVRHRMIARMIAISLASVLVLTVLMSVVSIGVGAAIRPLAAGPRVLRIGVAGQTAVTLNPNDITLVLEFIPVYNVYSTLATRDDRLNVVPDLASSWGVASDQVTWTFHLVRTAYFTDPLNPSDRSHTVTADDVVFSYNMVKDNTSSVLNAYTSFLDTITKVDDYTVQMTTTAPFAAMNSTLTSIPIFPKYLWQGIVDPVANEPHPYPVGSGPMYYDTNSDLNSHIILHRNPNFYGDSVYCEKSRPDEVRFLLYTSSTTLIDDFGSGTSHLDAIFNIPAVSFVNAASLNQPTVTKIQVAGGFVGELSSNVLTDALRAQYAANPDFIDLASGHNNQILATNLVVRQAIAMSVDRGAIVRYAYQGLGTVGDTLVPASNPWHYSIPQNQQYRFNTTAARQMLNAAGWSYDMLGNLNPSATPLAKVGGADPLIFRFYAPTSHPEFEPAVANISIWLRQTGIQTTDSTGNPTPGYEIKDTNQMNSIWSALDYDIWLWDWVFTRVSDPSIDVLQVQTTGAIGILSDNGYTNATFDAMYNQSLTTFDPVARRAITDSMQKMLYDYASYIIPYYPNDLYAVTSDPTLGSGWLDWGNWAIEPGLTVDSDLANLWYHLAPPDNRPPVISAFPSVDYVAGSPTTLSVIASDPEGAATTYTWNFGDGTSPATTTTNSVAHTFASPGTYVVKVRVADSEWPVCASTTAAISPAAVNLPPVATVDVLFPVTGHGWANEALTLQVIVSDPEGDPLNVTWDFGDGIEAVDQRTSTSTDTPVIRSHTYAAAGNYTLNVTVTDNRAGSAHTQVKTATVPIWSRTSGAGPIGPAALNPLINYGLPLGIVAVILVAAAVVLRRRQGRMREERREESPRDQPPPP